MVDYNENKAKKQHDDNNSEKTRLCRKQTIEVNVKTMNPKKMLRCDDDDNDADVNSRNNKNKVRVYECQIERSA
jgi:hypothetical protein